jgi:phosphotransferase system IIB component
VQVANADAIDETKLQSLGLRGLARMSDDRVHVLVGPSAEAVRDELAELIGGS